FTTRPSLTSTSTLFPYTTLFRSGEQQDDRCHDRDDRGSHGHEALAAEEGQEVGQLGVLKAVVGKSADQAAQDADEGVGDLAESKDRKSTRLNSSHVSISYAVFCL